MAVLKYYYKNSIQANKYQSSIESLSSAPLKVYTWLTKNQDKALNLDEVAFGSRI
jgi:hypothetical protein